MCLECGIVCTNIPPGRDNCNECTNKSSSFSSTTTTSTSSTTQSSNELNEMIEFIEDMGFERPVILAAIMKLQLDDEPNINTENVVVAINDLMAPLKNETSPPKQETVTSTSSTSSLYPPLSPTASNQVPPPIFQPPTSLPSPSAPPLHSQHSEGLDNDRTKCKICYEHDIDTVLIPCGHRVVCIHCSAPLQNCPICRVSILQVIKTYDT